MIVVKCGKAVYNLIILDLQKAGELMLNLSQIQTSVQKRAEQYGAERVFLFGSYARGDANESSDVDLRIDKGRIIGGIMLAGLMLDIENDLGKSVDLVTTASLDENFLREIRKEEKLLYEKK